MIATRSSSLQQELSLVGLNDWQRLRPNVRPPFLGYKIGCSLGCDGAV